MGRRNQNQTQPQAGSLAREVKLTDLDIETRLRQAALSRIQIRQQEDELVAVALSRGWSFTRIGRALGIPTSTVVRRYGSPS